MAVSVKIEGLKELEAALAEFKKPTARNIVQRALVTAGQPMADHARSLVPVESGELRDSITVMAITQNATREAGKAAYAATMRAGGSRDDARSALLSAQREAAGGSSVSVAIGPGPVRYANIVEFGSVAHVIRPRKRRGKKRLAFEEGGQFVAPAEVQHPGTPPHPYLRPAWEGGKDQALASIREQIGVEIDKAAQRAARRAAKLAAKG